MCESNSRGPGFLAPVARKIIACKLDISVGMPGPHDFAVRDRRIRLVRQSVHRIPPYVFDDRETPLEKDGTATQYYCFYPAVKKYF